MSVAVLRTPFQLEKYCWPAPEKQHETKDDHVMAVEDDHDQPGQFDIWSAIQAQKAASPVAAADSPAPYVHHALARRSLNQNSLQMCTESLGSETGSDDFSSFLNGFDVDSLPKFETDIEDEEEKHKMHDHLGVVVEERGVWISNETEQRRVTQQRKGKGMTSVNYHCSISRRSAPRSFPPPLPSISRRDAPCLHMRPHRRDGRLVVDAVPVPSRNYLHAQREGGRLVLSFIDATFDDPSFDDASTDAINIDEKNCYEDEEGEEEEEVEVAERGTVVEVKVSTQPQQQSGGGMKVLRSSLVINKFVGGTPMSSNAKCQLLPPPEYEANKTIHNNNYNQDKAMTAAPVARRPPPTTATSVAAVVVASILSASAEACNENNHGGERPLRGDDGRHRPLDNKLLFASKSKRRSREELLHSMRRCSELRRPLFIWEPCCISTSYCSTAGAIVAQDIADVHCLKWGVTGSVDIQAIITRYTYSY